MARRSIICLCLRHRQIIDLLATDKSRYFARPRPIIDNCWSLRRRLMRYKRTTCEFKSSLSQIHVYNVVLAFYHEYAWKTVGFVQIRSTAQNETNITSIIHFQQTIDLTNYSCLPNGLVSMFVSFSLASACIKVNMFPLFLHEFVCCCA